MSSIFRVDYNKLIKLLLPVMLRRPVLIALLETVVSPVDILYGRFLSNRDSNLYRLGITPQVCFLEKALNDRFDISARGIYIDDGMFFDELYLFTAGEAADEYIYTAKEAADIYIYTRSETADQGTDFIVNVPSTIRFDEYEMNALVEIYKLASKTFKINRV